MKIKTFSFLTNKFLFLIFFLLLGTFLNTIYLYLKIKWKNMQKIYLTVLNIIYMNTINGIDIGYIIHPS